MSFYSFTILIFIFQFVHVTFSCGGYDVKVTKVVSGVGNNAKVEPTIKASLNGTCFLFLDACLTLDRPFTSATITFDAQKEFPFIGYQKFYGLKDEDVCKRLEEYNLPRCPLLNAGRYCNNATNAIDLSKYESLIGLAAGNAKVINATVAYDNSPKLDSFDLYITVFKK